jgi:DNA-binding FadR family transcriptional regulator
MNIPATFKLDNVHYALNRQVVDVVGRRIVTGDWSPGTVLPKEDQIASMLGTSRSVVREAMKILATKGLVEARPRRGTIVSERSRWNLFDPDILAWWPRAALKRDFAGAFMQLRSVIEPAAAELAAQHGTDPQVEDLATAFKAMITAKDPAAFSSADVAYHRALLIASGNILFAQLASVIEPLFLAIIDREEADVPAPQDESIRLHGEVLDAVTNRTPELARAAMERLLRVTIGIFQAKGQAGSVGTN